MAPGRVAELEVLGEALIEDVVEGCVHVIHGATRVVHVAAGGENMLLWAPAKVEGIIWVQARVGGGIEVLVCRKLSRACVEIAEEKEQRAPCWAGACHH